MKIAVHAFLVYITLNSVMEKSEVNAIQIPKIFLRFPEESKAIWSKFKECLKDQNETESKEIRKNFNKCKKERKAEVKKLKKLMKQMDLKSIQKQTSDSSAKLWSDVKACLKDKDEAQSKLIWSAFTECMKVEDNDEFLVNVKSCLGEKDPLQQGGIWSEFKECMNDKE